MSMSRLDQLYRRLLLTKFFTKGWGKPDNLKRLFDFRKIISNRETCQHLVNSDYPVNIDKEYRDGDCRILEGHFLSPFIDHVPGIMPKEVETASFQMILPVKWRDPNHKPVCIHLAGTGDHYFWRRRMFTARPILKEAGIASILLENPYYGTRKPKQQLRSSLHNVSDLFVMGAALVLESLVLLHWCERNGWGPLGISGISMGGHMASLAATNWTKPVSLIPCLSWSTASCVFTQGVMSGAIPWKTLQEQFFENSLYQNELRQLIISPEDHLRKSYEMGQQFVKDYSEKIQHMEAMHKHHQEQDSVLTSQQCENSTPIMSQDTLKPRDMNVDYIHSRLSEDTERNNSRQDSHSSSSEQESSKIDVCVSGTYWIPQQEYLVRDGDSSAAQSFKNVVNNSSFSSSDSKSEKPKSSGLRPWLPSSIPASSDGMSTFSPALTDSSITKIDNTGEKIRSGKTVQSPSRTKMNQKLSKENLSLTLKHALSKSSLSVSRKPSLKEEEDVQSLRNEALDFMRGVMDECTHLGNFSVPVDPELIIIVSAKQDAYVPKDGVLGLDQLWPGCEVRQIDQGHVGAVLLHQPVFRKAIIDAFDKQVKKYHGGKGSGTWTAGL